jgi:hypothetical protein
MMTKRELQKIRSRLAGLYNSIEGSSTADIVSEIVELELLLEAESNQ